MIKYIRTSKSLERFEKIYIETSYIQGVIDYSKGHELFMIKINTEVIWLVECEYTGENINKYYLIADKMLSYIIENYINTNKEILNTTDLYKEIKSVHLEIYE